MKLKIFTLRFSDTANGFDDKPIQEFTAGVQYVMNPRVSKVTAIDDYRLQIVFTSGERGIYDCTHLLNFGVFTELKDKNYFNQVRPCHGTVAWPNEQDICPDTLYLDSEKKNAQQNKD